jgi:antitoxin HicB
LTISSVVSCKQGAMPRYTIVLDPDQEQRGFTVTVPALPGCISEGETVEECVANAEEAIALYLGDLTARGEPVPEERESPRLIVVDVSPDRPQGRSPAV